MEYMMSLFSNVFKSVSLCLALSATTAFAATIIPPTTIDDANNDHVGGYQFDVESMDVQLTADGQMQVDVFTNFGNWNNRIGTGNRGNGNIVFGDLLIGTAGVEGTFDYAFQLTELARTNDYMDPVVGTKHVANGGNLYKINDTLSAKQYHGRRSSVESGFTPVVGVTTGASLGLGSLSVGTKYASTTRNDANYGYDKISFVFNVGDIFKDSSQIALSWAMTCYNDAVSGLVNVSNDGGGGGGGTPVPEPQTLLLMLLGIVGIATRRKQQAFKA
jgi:hypothetical protein